MMTTTASAPATQWASQDMLDRIQDMLDRIKALPAARQHHLAPRMVDGSPLTLPAAAGVLRTLNRCLSRSAGAQDLQEEPVPEPESRPGQLPPRLAELLEQVPDGYYATASRTGTNDLDFWWVHTKKGSSKHVGRRFVDRYLGGQSPVAVPPLQARYALQAIVEAGTEEAGNAFADNLGCCRDCGRDLTDDESRAARRGPVCRSRGK
jgi:Family of unknown function (DUF6011)